MIDVDKLKMYFAGVFHLSFLKKLSSKKYFWVIFFFILVVFFSFMLHIVIENDRKASLPTDDMLRTIGKVTNIPDSYSITEDGTAKEVYSNVQVLVELNDKETYETTLIGQVPKKSAGELDYGTLIKLKYSDNDHTAFYYADDPPERHRVFLYVIFGILIAASIGATVFSSKVLNILSHRKVMQENMENIRKQRAQSEEDASRYKGVDGNDSTEDYVPFQDQGIDYNARYQQDQSMNAAGYSAEDTFSGDSIYSSGDPSAPYTGYTSGSSSQNDPSAPYTGYDTSAVQNDQTAYPDTPYTGYTSGSASQNDTSAPYTGYGTDAAAQNEPAIYPNAVPGGTDNASASTSSSTTPTYSDYGMPNASMDAPYDPNAPYTGYGMPNVSMDAPYDPNAPYTGYGG